MLDGSADDIPFLTDPEEYQRWSEVCSKEYLDLRDKVKHGKPTFFDSYAATDDAEFFAVMTEYFFVNPKICNTITQNFMRFYRVFVGKTRHRKYLPVKVFAYVQ